MRLYPRTALGFGLLKDSSTRSVTHAAGRGDLNDRNTVNSEAAATESTIRRQLAALDARPADGMDEKDAVRKKLLARLDTVQRQAAARAMP